ncbi:conserved hypothetical protein (plasmid) [Methanohalobium evestigatum Z-7303]|uniref:AttH domain-containing protein n=1 Tax=Methanohalobium evestigatum (strain ATCC BAA-1072 / DSM 3721 / NBRC 107634 / OCM 161 / Z-7303) TaxID=644295 RepID=D7EC06_METEZ|nr:hypothetical protein [Methanohalobium evestigatum]ADI75128.1 conserved hypothetical protein [Methanohalobium evestigatum Z-7303]
MKSIYYLALAIICLIIATGTISAQPFENNGWKNNPNLDFTEGGNFEDDFDADMMAEWWYLNGDTKLVGQNGEKKDFSFFVVLAHQEINETLQTNLGAEKPQSYMLSFNGLYFDGETEADFNFIDTNVSRENVTNYIAFGTPYVNYNYPDGSKSLTGNHLSGYHLDYETDRVDMDLYFQTNVDKTVDESVNSLNFTTYERSYGRLHGKITIDGVDYRVTQANGYMDHMIPSNNINHNYGELSWTTNMHGWSWSEVTTKNYQTIAYAVRGIDDGYDNYSYKHLTLLDKHTGKVLEEYSGNEIKINETNLIDTGYPDNTRSNNITRPETVTFSTSDSRLNVTITASQVAEFDYDPVSPFGKPVGFVDFMSHQPDGALIEYKGDRETGSAFYEYLVSDRVLW